MTESAVMRVRQYPPALLALGWLLEEDATSKTTMLFDAIETVQDACSVVNLWQQGLDEEMVWLEEQADTRVKLAEQWLLLQQEHPWQAAFTGRRQLTSTLGRMHPGDEPFVLTSERDTMWFHPAQALVTTTELEDTGRRTQWNGGPLGYARSGQRLWGLQPTNEARVYEIRTAADWQALVSDYPRLVTPDRFNWNNCYAAFPGPFYLPAWDRVATDWDAVRFMLSGIICCDFALVEVLDGYTMLIDEETGEQTIWLRWIFESVQDLGDVGDYFREPEPVTIDLPEYVLQPVAKARQRLLEEATESMKRSTEGREPLSSPPPGDANDRLLRRIDLPPVAPD